MSAPAPTHVHPSPVGIDVLELDLDTLADIRPVCEIHDYCENGHLEPCDLEARWVLRFNCPQGHDHTKLVCDLHHADLAGDPVAHTFNYRWERL